MGWMDCPPVSPGGGSEVPEALLEPGVGRGSPGARGEGGRRAGSAPGAGRSRAARVGYRGRAGMWEGGVWVFPSFSLVVAFMAGNAHFVSLQEARLPCLP